jgi:hypothetical protein
LQQTVRKRTLEIGINYFKKGCQPRSNLVKDENGDLLAICIQNISELTEENYNCSLIKILVQVTVLAKGNTPDDG